MNLKNCQKDDLANINVLSTVLKKNSLKQLDKPIELASGIFSKDFIDVKRTLCEWSNLSLACQIIIKQMKIRNLKFTVAGGMTMGADCLSIGLSALTGCRWFSIRKTPKKRGLNRLIEGAALKSGDKVLLLEDVVTTGDSVLKALQIVRNQGVSVVAVVTLVNRSYIAEDKITKQGVPFFSILTFKNMGIKPIAPLSV